MGSTESFLIIRFIHGIDKCLITWIIKEFSGKFFYQHFVSRKTSKHLFVITFNRTIALFNCHCIFLLSIRHPPYFHGLFPGLYIIYISLSLW